MSQQQRYVIIDGRVYRWEEKEPFSESGESIWGAVAYDESRGLKCHECPGWYERLGVHVARRHGSVARYKASHGLRRSTGLLTPSLKAAQAQVLAATRVHYPLIGFQKGCVPPRRDPRAVVGTTGELQNERMECPAQLVAKIQKIASELGHVPTAALAGHRLRHQATKRFGGWRQLCEAAGLPVNRGRKPPIYSKGILIELLRDFWHLHKRLPRCRDYSTGSLPSMHVFCDNFGNVKGALEAAGLGLVARKVA